MNTSGCYGYTATSIVLLFPWGKLCSTLRTWFSLIVQKDSLHVQPMCDKAGLHLEIDPRGGKMSIYKKEGGRSPVYMCISTCTLMGSGGQAPLNFRF